MKKALCFVLILVLSITLWGNIAPKAETAPSQVDVIINFAKSKIGSTEYVGLCQAFVYQCYKAAGIDNGSASSAIAAWKKWGVSTSKTNIPIGACVYFNENVGSPYGHVGIYIGNNKMIHSRQSVGQVVESSLTWYFDNCYLGWGWQGGVEPSSTSSADSSNTQVNDYYLLTAPDGIQTMRDTDSTSGNKILDIPAQTIVCVTKYNSDKTWGYVTYNGKSGWIRLYYVEKHNHSYGSWTTISAATCTTAGSAKRTCSCGKAETKTLSALGHNYSSSYTTDTSATCTAAGSKSKHCTRCSAKTSVTSIPATGHKWSEFEKTIEPTIENEGLCVRRCQNDNCNASESKVLPKLATDGHTHSFGDFDCDGKITVADALAALRIAAKMADETAEGIAIGDIDKDGTVTVADALAILRVAAKMSDSL